MTTSDGIERFGFTTPRLSSKPWSSDATGDFHGLDWQALWEDLKAAGSVGRRYLSSWERLAVVTDKDWVRQGIAVFGWLTPGEIRVFEPGELESAKAWTGGAPA